MRSVTNPSASPAERSSPPHRARHANACTTTNRCSELATRWCLAILLGLVLLTRATGAESDPPPTSPTADVLRAGEQFVDLLTRQEYAAAVLNFDAAMTRAMTPEKLAQAWTSLLSQAGPYQARIASRVEPVQAFQVVVVTCQFQKALMDIRVVFDRSQRVTGLWFAPAKPVGNDSTPDYVNAQAFTEREQTVGEAPWALPATLCLPKGNGPFPGLVLVHGSGPQDRDETIGPNKPFRDLAHGLASRGIAVLRYEKRTKAHPLPMTAMAGSLTVKEETVDDALAAVDSLRLNAQIRPDAVFILGHSLGGMLIPRIGERDPRIRGFIVLAGAARPLEDLILDQVRYITSLDTNQATAGSQTQLKTIQAQVARVKDPALSTSTPALELPLGIPPVYWLDLRHYRPAEAARALNRPILVLQGGRDYQVTEADFNLWKASLQDHPNATLRFHPNLNHLFFVGDQKATPAEYLQPGHVAPLVIDELSSWIHAAAPPPAPKD